MRTSDESHTSSHRATRMRVAFPPAGEVTGDVNPRGLGSIHWYKYVPMSVCHTIQYQHRIVP
jgi:hypothetical protein